MRVPLSWLSDYVALEMPVESLVERLDMSTAVVAAVERRGVPDEDGNLGLFRVGKVLEAAKHPNADRLQLCVVDVGSRSRTGSCAEHGTSVPARPSRSRFRATSRRSRCSSGESYGGRSPPG